MKSKRTRKDRESAEKTTGITSSCLSDSGWTPVKTLKGSWSRGAFSTNCGPQQPRPQDGSPKAASRWITSRWLPLVASYLLRWMRSRQHGSAEVFMCLCPELQRRKLCEGAWSADRRWWAVTVICDCLSLVWQAPLPL